MSRPNVTQPVTDNAERAPAQNNRQTFAPDEGEGKPSRAHPDKSGGDHEKKPSRSAPKHGG